MFGNSIGPGEILIVLVIALLIFGPKKLPELGKGLGRGMRDFKRAVSGDDDDERREEETAKKAAAPLPAPVVEAPVVTSAPPPAAPVEATPVQAAPVEAAPVETAAPEAVTEAASGADDAR